MKRLLSLASLALLTACSGTGGAPQSGAPRNDGVADKLPLGVSQAEVEARMGLDRGFERNPANYDESCVSYAYGDEAATRFVHAVFVSDRLVRASDGHGVLCTYGTLTSKQV